ncbi:MAG: DeoR family transcriptional regulator [Bacteroidia bacterium]|nr:DeoR family transcriptional regulator [Bacteroidia bacterium]
MNILITDINGFVGSNFTKDWSKNHTLYGLGINQTPKERVKEIFNCKEYNLPTPRFENISDGFMVTLYSNNRLDVPVDILLNKRQKEIIRHIANNPNIAINLLTENFAVSRKTIMRDLEYLRNKNLIE